MKYYVLDDYRKKENKKINKKKVIQFIALLCLLVAIIVLFSFYVANDQFRAWIDIYIFRKEITENTGVIIEADTEANNYIYAYDKYVVVLSNNILQIYNSNGTKEFEIEVNITSPIFASSGKYICVAEKGR